MKKIIAVLLFTFVASLAYADEYYDYALGEYNHMLELRDTITGWKKSEYSSKYSTDYTVHYKGVNYYKNVYNVRTIPEAYEIEAFEHNNPNMPKVKPLPSQSTKQGDNQYFFIGAEGVYIDGFKVCNFLFSKNKDGFIELLTYCPGI